MLKVEVELGGCDREGTAEPDKKMCIICNMLK